MSGLSMTKLGKHNVHIDSEGEEAALTPDDEKLITSTMDKLLKSAAQQASQVNSTSRSGPIATRLTKRRTL